MKILTRKLSTIQDPWSPEEKLCFSLLSHSPIPLPFPSLLQIHAFLLRRHLLSNLLLLSRLLSSSPSLPYSLRLFHHRPSDDPLLCNSILRSLVSHHRFPDSLSLYRNLRRRRQFRPDSFTFTLLFKSCARLGDPLHRSEGPQIHAHVVKFGFCSDLFSATALLDMYAKCGFLISGRKVFDGMAVRNAVSWTSMAVGYARGGDAGAAMELFLEMPEKDLAAFNALIDVFVKSGDLGSARRVFDKMPERNVVSWTSLLSGYCKDGRMEAARVLFDGMKEKNLFSWNVMIGGYCQNRQPLLALELFRELQSGSFPFQPDKVTLVSVLPAIADIGAIELGRWIHSYVRRKRVEFTSSVSTALLDMYAKCGDTSEARQVFDAMHERPTSAWNAMINGLAVNGRAKEALDVFMEMQRSGMQPNGVTMMGVLSACNHGGLVDEGRRWFRKMETYGINQTVEHYGCMVDLLGRRGHLEEAEALVEGMPFNANEIILTSLLFACVTYGDVDRAERVMRRGAQFEVTADARNYVMLRNLYAGEKRWGDVERMKDMMSKFGGKKEAGCSVIEDGNMVLEFVSGDRLHPHWEMISDVLRDLHLHLQVPKVGEMRILV